MRRFTYLHREAVINQLDHVVQLVVQDLDLPQDGQLFLLAADGRLGGVARSRRRQEPPGSGRRREVHPDGRERESGKKTLMRVVIDVGCLEEDVIPGASSLEHR